MDGDAALPPFAACHLKVIQNEEEGPFHIHNPERTITGRKTNRVAGA
jgi:hypothetical protein